MTITAEELKEAVRVLESHVKRGAKPLIEPYLGIYHEALPIYKLALQSLQPPADLAELGRLHAAYAKGREMNSGIRWDEHERNWVNWICATYKEFPGLLTEIGRLRQDAARLDALEAMLDDGPVVIKTDFDGQTFLGTLDEVKSVHDTLRAAIDAQLKNKRA